MTNRREFLLGAGAAAVSAALPAVAVASSGDVMTPAMIERAKEIFLAPVPFNAMLAQLEWARQIIEETTGLNPELLGANNGH